MLTTGLFISTVEAAITLVKPVRNNDEQCRERGRAPAADTSSRRLKIGRERWQSLPSTLAAYLQPSQDLADPPALDRAIALVEEWMADESSYDEQAWPELKQALNAERQAQGMQTLFDE